MRSHRPNVKLSQQIYWNDGKQVTRTTIDLLDQAAGIDGLLMGITDDVPAMLPQPDPAGPGYLWRLSLIL